MAFHFDTTYTRLGEGFYSFVTPKPVKNPQILLLNTDLMQKLGIKESADLVEYFSAQKLLEKPLAMAYAGHQFGYFTMLGDGRAALLGEHLTSKDERYDIALKGLGITPYSRGGDGKATVSSMLREYLFCSSLHTLGIKSSQALAVVLTNKKVYREKSEPGALLVRVMQSHVRIGTFEYASNYLNDKELQRLSDYVIARHYSYVLDKSGNKYLYFFEAVMENLIDMVVNWLRVGFVHGVMNTDNMSITGETFDYGPCAFMNFYDLQATFSSIDRGSRYSFGNQKGILHWNLARFAQTLLPLVGADQMQAVETMNEILKDFENRFDAKFYAMMHEKLGIAPYHRDDALVDELLEWLQTSKADYTNTFLALIDEYEDSVYKDTEFVAFKQKLAKIGLDKTLMKRNNPYFIPRNYLVEEAIDEYDKKGSLEKIKKLLAVMENPYKDNIAYKDYQKPPSNEFDKEYTTFCNT